MKPYQVEQCLIIALENLYDADIKINNARNLILEAETEDLSKRLSDLCDRMNETILSLKETLKK